MKNLEENYMIPYLSLKNIDKFFGNTKALQQMNLEIYLGEVIGILGPNGAGKSTLMKVITGVHQQTNGEVVFNREDSVEDNYNANIAKSYGITCAYQELSLCSNLTVYENFMINHMDHTPFAKWGWRKQAIEKVENYLENVFPGHCIDVNTTVSDLSLAQKQMVEIAKAISYKNLKILILDEPTSSLAGDRIIQLHESMRKLARSGVAILYISHKLDEIEKACDKVVVMKGGTTCWQGNKNDTSTEALIEILGGQIKTAHKENQDNKNLPVAVEIKDLSTNKLHDISMYAKKGEIVGISGLDGSGQKELVMEIFKASKSHKKSNIDIKSKICYISGDRQNEGIFPLWDIADNTMLSSLDQVRGKGLIKKSKFTALAQFWYDKLRFTAQGIHENITNLSGGNQQKALLARGLAANADLILLNDPTCGVDIETKQGIYKLLDEAKNQGKAVILHSTEDLEMEQCDRVYVMHEGKIIEELVGDNINVANIIKTSFKEKSKGTHDIQNNESTTKRKNGITGKIVTNRSSLAFAALIVIFIIIASLNHRVMSYMGIQLVYSSAIPLVFMALGQMFIVISGGIDFGNGMSLGLMNVIIAFTIVRTPSLGIIYIILFVIAYAGIGAIIYLTKIPAIVITLGASFIWLGIALIISPTPGGQAPSWLNAIFSYKFPIVPMPIIISILAMLVSYWIVKKSKYGMIINGIGNNPTAIERAGWSQMIAMMVTYAIGGLMVVIGALMLTAISNSGDCNAATSYNMLSVATIILGGCEFSGGISSPVGVVVAALALSSISFLLTFLGINSNLQSAVTGFILIIALALKLISNKMEEKK